MYFWDNCSEKSVKKLQGDNFSAIKQHSAICDIPRQYANVADLIKAFEIIQASE